MDKIYPSIRQGELARSIDQAITNTHIIQLFDGNHVTLFDLNSNEATPIEFNLPNTTQLTTILANRSLPQLVCFKNDQYFCIINFNSFKVMKKGEGRFFWRNFDEYLIVKGEKITLYSLKED